MTNKFRHVGIVVSEIEDHSEFLTKVLDFKVISDQIESGPFISQMLQIESVEVRTVKFRGVDNGIIELLKFQIPRDLSKEDLLMLPNSLGITHIAITVNSAAHIHRLCVERELVPFSEPLISPNGEVRVFYLRGPDQILYEIVEELTK